MNNTSECLTPCANYLHLNSSLGHVCRFCEDNDVFHPFFSTEKYVADASKLTVLFTGGHVPIYVGQAHKAGQYVLVSFCGGARQTYWPALWAGPT
jgi:hypothetical protein